MRTPTTVVLDVAAVVVFVAIGRASHDEAASVTGFLGTLWPFAVGLLVGILLRRRDRERLPAGAASWFCTLVIGMLLRVASGQGIAPTFVLVAALFLGLTLLGWRALALLVDRQHARS